MPARSFLALLLLAIGLASCGAAAPSAAETPTPVIETPTAPVALAAPTATPSPVIEPALTAVAQQVAAQSYNTALDILVPLYEANSTNVELANALAALYAEAGQALLEEANGQIASIGDAYFMFSKGLDAHPTDEQIRQQLQVSQSLSEALVTASQELSRLGRLISAGSPLAEQQAVADQLHMLLSRVMAERPAYLTTLPADQVLAIIVVAEASGDALKFGPEAEAFYAQAADVAGWLVEQAAATPAGASAAERLPVLLEKKDPPPTPTPTIKPTIPSVAPSPAKLRFKTINYNDAPDCITVQIRGVGTGGWRFSVDGLRVSGSFDASGNARACGVGPGQEVTISVFNPAGQVVPGGGGVPSKGSAIMVADWR